MERTTLEVIQKLMKIGKIFSKIVYVFCIVGAIICLVGIIGLGVDGGEAFKIGGVTVRGIIQTSDTLTLGTAYATAVAGLILSLGEAILAKFAVNYFENELAAGTPFTFEGAKELMRLGILTIVLPIAFIVAADISYAIVNKMFTDVADMHVDEYASVGLGVGMILASLLCKLGARQAENLEAAVPAEIEAIETIED